MNPNSKRIAKNTIFLYIRMGILMFISLFTSRVLLDKLGAQDYGIYNVIGGVTSMFAFFSSSLANATQRYLNIELGRKDLKKATLIFQQHLTLYLVIMIGIIIVAEPIGIWLILKKLVIPPDRIFAAICVYQFTLLSLCFTFVGIVFNSEIVSHEDMKIYSYIGIVEGIAKLLICYIISIADNNRLILYGFLLLVVNACIQGSYAFSCIKKYKECKIKLIWNKDIIKGTTNIIGWNLFGTVAFMANDNLINILLNMFFGPVVNAARAISYQINAALNNFTNNFFVSVRPQLMKSYARDDFAYLKNLLFKSTRLSFYLIYILGIPIIFCVNQVLDLWLKQVPQYTNIFTVLIICYSFITVVHGPLWDVALASGQIKKYQLVGSGIFIMVFPISYIFLKLCYPPTSVFYIMIAVRLVYYMSSVSIVSKIAKFSISSYLYEIFSPIIKVVIISLAIHFIMRHFVPYTTFYMFVFIALSLIINSSIIFVLGIDKHERDWIIETVRKKL